MTDRQVVVEEADPAQADQEEQQKYAGRRWEVLVDQMRSQVSNGGGGEDDRPAHRRGAQFDLVLQRHVDVDGLTESLPQEQAGSQHPQLPIAPCGPDRGRSGRGGTAEQGSGVPGDRLSRPR